MSEQQLVVGSDAFNCGIQKSLLNAGTTKVPYPDGAKVYFHYKTIRKSDEAIIDDSKKFSKPMELIIGKKFKLEVWEQCLKTMWLNEVSKFSVVKELTFSYPVVAKQMREYYEKQEKSCCDHDHGHHKHDHDHDHHHSTHTCGYNAFKNGLGYKDLDELLKNPEQLDFIFEIVKVEQPGEYEKDSWALSDDERFKKIDELKEEGNKLYNNKEYEKAVEKYHLAISYLEQFMTREKPHDVEWNQLNEKKLKILLNYVQCKLCLNDFYSAIEHANTILEFDKTNIKALYRRAKAHRAVHNVDDAKNDLFKIIELDSNMKKLCLTELKQIDDEVKAANEKEKQMFKGKLFS